MTVIAHVSEADGTQTITLPDGFRLNSKMVGLRREGDTIVLEPIRPEAWPPGFFDRIRIDDLAFARPEQGDLPAAPEIAPRR